MRDHTDCRKSFYHTTAAYYWKNLPGFPDRIFDEVMVGMYHDDGGTSGEFAITWEWLGDSKVIRLKAFNDSWSALAQCSDLIEYMETLDENYVEPEEFIAKLVEMGYKDLTAREPK